MSKIDLGNLNTLQYDVLKELGNIGAGNATTALSKLINAKIDMRVPKVNLLGFSELASAMGKEEDIMVGILLLLEGDIDGMMMFLLEVDSARALVNSLMGKPNDNVGNNDINFDEMEYSALREIGNIITGSYLSALSDLTRLTIVSSVPSLQIDMAEAILSIPAIEFSKIGDKVLLIQTQFDDDSKISGYFVLVPELDSYDKILSSLGL
ncbi:MAG: chemotaxis protein CheC [Lachnospiraceae bacterium]|nr:chemotaxis protein CheC [Lachnospiraceae bacterium]